MANGKKRASGTNDAAKQTLGEKITRGLDIPPDILPGGSLISIRGRSSLSVNGSTSIILYTPNEIKLSMRKGALSVRGKELVCISYHSFEINIEGHIDSVNFEEGCDIG